MKRHKRLKETDDPREYRLIIQREICHNDGESWTKGWEYAVCDCLHHRRYWDIQTSKRIKRFKQNRKNWKFYRKTQYKNIEYETGDIKCHFLE